MEENKRNVGKLNFENRLVKFIENEFNFKIMDITIPPQGMSSQVFFIKTSINQEFAVKYGKDSFKDLPALKLIREEEIDIPIPNLLRYFSFEDISVIILDRIKFPLLESASKDEIYKYIPSIISNIRKLHQIKSDKPKLLSEVAKNKTWKELMMDIFINDNLNWEKISSRKGLDKKLVESSVEKILKKIDKTDFTDKTYSLLHTDLNQRNLFINPTNYGITGIIDWEGAMFGDPIYDFARIRMLIWHFDLDSTVIKDYYKLMNYTHNERELEDLYWLSRVIEYLAYYSEELNSFNTGRIKLHQDFLENYNW